MFTIWNKKKYKEFKEKVLLHLNRESASRDNPYGEIPVKVMIFDYEYLFGGYKESYLKKMEKDGKIKRYNNCYVSATFPEFSYYLEHNIKSIKEVKKLILNEVSDGLFIDAIYLYTEIFRKENYKHRIDETDFIRALRELEKEGYLTINGVELTFNLEKLEC